MAEANINEILGYIREREKNLSHYSDKLRKSIVKIAEVFGRDDLCRCGWFVDRHPIQKAGVIVCKTPVPKIHVSINVIDDEPFLVEPENATAPEIKYYLAIIKHHLGYVDVVGTYSDPSGVTAFDEAPRETLKALVKSGRLIPFLQKVANTLQGKSEEYREVAEVAEKLAKAVQ